ncbi:MAG: hypothetical protein R3F59_18320 [Myxococcota bacterium]
MTPLRQQRGEPDLEGEQRQLRHVGAPEARRAGGRQQRRAEVEVGVRADPLADGVHGVAERGLGGVELLSHAVPLRALAAEDEDGPQLLLHHTVDDAVRGPVGGVGVERRAPGSGAVAEDDEPVPVVLPPGRGGGGEVGRRALEARLGEPVPVRRDRVAQGVGARGRHEERLDPRRRRIGRCRRGGLLHDHVGVGAAEPERAHAGAAGPGAPRPGARHGADRQGRARQVDARVERAEV